MDSSSSFYPEFSRVAAAGGGGSIDDDHTLYTSTWSSQKISDELDTKADQTAIAPAYARLANYATGDYVTYQGRLLRCLRVISLAPATPDPADREETDLMEYIPVNATAAHVRSIITSYRAEE